MASAQPPMKRQKTDPGTVAVAAAVAAAVADAPTITAPEPDLEAAVAAPPPTCKVFIVVELLEQVLSNLNVTELTRVERVNSLWKKLIRTAPGLQEQRFLKATPVTELLTFTPAEKTIDSKCGRYNPRLTQDLTAKYQTRYLGIYHPASIIFNLHPCMSTIATHPTCVKWAWPYLLRSRFHSRSEPDTAIQSFAGTTYISICPQKMLSWAHGPWESMQISQPPCDLNGSSIKVQGGKGDWTRILQNVTTLGGLREVLARSRVVERSKLVEAMESNWKVTLMIRGTMLDADSDVQKARMVKANNAPTVGALSASEAETGADDPKA